ncbi:tRNA (N6-isopentenyl adenosine(37)-C2)-methylthiotransferase MiaB [Deferribacterales bacterium RsTz2092]|nr:tRNA-2-methylthio-N(6)-dimethylallyladenosine synthase [Deferribacterales bacterium]
MNSYFVQTFGCQMNEYDSERIAATLEERGLFPADGYKTADIVILNTCSVRESPQNKVSSYIGMLGKLHSKSGKPSIIGVMGCVAQQVGAQLLRKYPQVDFALGTDNLPMLDYALTRALSGERTSSLDVDATSFNVAPFKRRINVSVSISIMKGCNNFCSYCIVPYTRGREISRNVGEILAEAKALVHNGAKEITLLGQNVNSYGAGSSSSVDFPALLGQVAQIEGVVRLRFVTSHPKDFSEKLVHTIAGHDNICPLVHLPLQSGSDSVLKRMNRGYTWNQYLDKVQTALEFFPKLRFASDFIVGFPSETDEDFEATLAAVEQMKYESIFAFKYSSRPGTKANELDDNVPASVKSERLARLLKLQDSIASERYSALLGVCAKVLVEGVSKQDVSTMSGRTIYGRIVNFETTRAVNVGEEVEVVLTEVKKNTLFGRLK